MTRRFCDRCGRDVTGHGQVSALHGVEDEDDGNTSDQFDLCRACYRAVIVFAETGATTPHVPRVEPAKRTKGGARR